MKLNKEQTKIMETFIKKTDMSPKAMEYCNEDGFHVAGHDITVIDWDQLKEINKTEGIKNLFDVFIWLATDNIKKSMQKFDK